MIHPIEENPNNLDDQDDVNEIKAADDTSEPDAEADDLDPTKAALEQAAPIDPEIKED